MKTHRATSLVRSAGSILIGLLLWAAISGCGTHCDLTETMLEFAGEDAEWCGRDLPMEEADQGHECAVDAFLAGRPFIVSFQRMGTDSLVRTGVAGNGTGAFRDYIYDGDIGGGGGTGNPRITEFLCPNGGTVMTNDSARSRPELMAGTRYLVCESGVAIDEHCD